MYKMNVYSTDAYHFSRTHTYIYIHSFWAVNKVSRATKGQLFAAAYPSLGPCHTHGIHGDRPSFLVVIVTHRYSSLKKQPQ